MQVLWFVSVFIVSCAFYFIGLSGDDCGGLKRLGDAGINVLFLFLIYTVLNIYIYHWRRLHGKLDQAWSIWFSIWISLSAIMLPLTAGVSQNFGGSLLLPSNCIFSLNPFVVFSGLFMILLLLDRDGSKQENLLSFYEKSLKRNESDLFVKYPPEQLSDIYWQLGIFTFVTFVIVIFL